MKCIKHGEVIKRVTDEEADKQVSAGLGLPTAPVESGRKRFVVLSK